MTRREDAGSLSRNDDFSVDRELNFSFQNKEGLVLALMHVRRRSATRSYQDFRRQECPGALVPRDEHPIGISCRRQVLAGLTENRERNQSRRSHRYRFAIYAIESSLKATPEMTVKPSRPPRRPNLAPAAHIGRR